MSHKWKTLAPVEEYINPINHSCRYKIDAILVMKFIFRAHLLLMFESVFAQVENTFEFDIDVAQVENTCASRRKTLAPVEDFHSGKPN
jgi:hypothetical protein